MVVSSDDVSASTAFGGSVPNAREPVHFWILVDGFEKIVQSTVYLVL